MFFILTQLECLEMEENRFFVCVFLISIPTSYCRGDSSLSRGEWKTKICVDLKQFIYFIGILSIRHRAIHNSPWENKNMANFFEERKNRRQRKIEYCCSFNSFASMCCLKSANSRWQTKWTAEKKNTIKIKLIVIVALVSFANTETQIRDVRKKRPSKKVALYSVLSNITIKIDVRISCALDRFKRQLDKHLLRMCAKN